MVEAGAPMCLVKERNASWAERQVEDGSPGSVPRYNNPPERERPECTRKPGAGARKWARAFFLPSADSRIFRLRAHFAPHSARLVRLARPGGGTNPASAIAASATNSDHRSGFLLALGLASPLAPTGRKEREGSLEKLVAAAEAGAGEADRYYVTGKTVSPPH